MEGGAAWEGRSSACLKGPRSSAAAHASETWKVFAAAAAAKRKRRCVPLRGAVRGSRVKGEGEFLKGCGAMETRTPDV